MMLVTGLFAYIEGVLLYSVRQAVLKGPPVQLGQVFLAGMFLFFGLTRWGDRKGTQQLLYRCPGAVDPGQRPGLERHAPPGRLVVGRGGVSWVWIDRAGRTDLYRGSVLLVAAGLIPVVYSFVHYKALERRGEL